MSKPERRYSDFLSPLVYLSTFHSVNTIGVLTSQYFSPQGYSENVSGLMGATLLFAGIISAAISSPIFDRVLTRHLGLTIRVLVPILSALWLSLIWAGESPELLRCLLG